MVILEAVCAAAVERYCVALRDICNILSTSFIWVRCIRLHLFWLGVANKLAAECTFNIICSVVRHISYYSIQKITVN